MVFMYETIEKCLYYDKIRKRTNIPIFIIITNVSFIAEGEML